MRFRVVVQPSAEDDLNAILHYIAQDSPRRAIRVVARLAQATEELGEAALRYPLVPRHEDRGVRRRVVGVYKIYYRVSGDRVDILHILHSARDIRTFFGDD